MTAADRLIAKAAEYEQLAELEQAAGDDERAATPFATIAVALREVAEALDHDGEQEAA